MSDQSTILTRLQRLMAMTVENGASEAEAMLAAAKASELMQQHGLSFKSVEEIEAQHFSDDTRDWFVGSKGRRRSAPVPPAHRCLAAICDLCGVEHLFSTYTGTLTFFGAKHATEVAHYLVIIISRAMDREWENYQATVPRGLRRNARASFYVGISMRISERLQHMHHEQLKSFGDTTSGGLVVVQNALVKERFSARHPSVKVHAARVNPSNIGGAIAGIEAGDRVALNRAVTDAHRPAQIAGPSQRKEVPA